MVAIAAHFAALAEDRVTFYTAPIKALVSEKFFALCEIFGAENVGMLTGDASVNSGAPIICCTAEVLANIALREGADADVGQVVMDEFHFYAEPQRGWAWQVPLLSLPQAQFLLMSATLGDVTALARGPDAADRARDGARRRRRAARAAALLAGRWSRCTSCSRSWCGPIRRRSTSCTSRRPRRWSARSRCCRRSSARARSATRSPTRSARFRFTAGFGRTLSQARPQRHRRPPRRHAAALPPAGRAARADRAAEGDLRDRHARRRHQRPDPHRRLHRAGEVRRHAATGC